MTNPVSDSALDPEEMRGLCDYAQEIMARTDSALTLNRYEEIGVHMKDLENADGGVEHVAKELKKARRELDNSIDSVDSLRKDIARHFEQSKRRYWELRKSTP